MGSVLVDAGSCHSYNLLLLLPVQGYLRGEESSSECHSAVMRQQAFIGGKQKKKLHQECSLKPNLAILYIPDSLISHS